MDVDGLFEFVATLFSGENEDDSSSSALYNQSWGSDYWDEDSDYWDD